MTTPLKVGLFGIGLAAYWSQFAGLRDLLSGFMEQIARQIARPGVEITNLGRIDTPEKALIAGHMGPILEIGNTNSRYQFSVGARKFLRDWNAHGPAHHRAVGEGHLSSRFKKLGALLRMECVQVC